MARMDAILRATPALMRVLTIIRDLDLPGPGSAPFG